jgi:hypothetical protein
MTQMNVAPRGTTELYDPNEHLLHAAQQNYMTQMNVAPRGTTELYDPNEHCSIGAQQNCMTHKLQWVSFCPKQN